MSKKSSSDGRFSCGCMILVLLINPLLGGFCFNYSLGAIWGTHLSWFLAALGGLFLGEIAIPAALIIWLITLSGVATPFIR